MKPDKKERDLSEGRVFVLSRLKDLSQEMKEKNQEKEEKQKSSCAWNKIGDEGNC